MVSRMTLVLVEILGVQVSGLKSRHGHADHLVSENEFDRNGTVTLDWRLK